MAASTSTLSRLLRCTLRVRDGCRAKDEFLLFLLPQMPTSLGNRFPLALALPQLRVCLLRLLTLRPTGLSSPAYRDLIDYIVIQEGRAVGRICEDCHTLPDPVAGLEGPEVVR
jgi:hypothetical protein